MIHGTDIHTTDAGRPRERNRVDSSTLEGSALLDGDRTSRPQDPHALRPQAAVHDSPESVPGTAPQVDAPARTTLRSQERLASVRFFGAIGAPH